MKNGKDCSRILDGISAPTAHAIDFAFCDRDAGCAEEITRKYMATHYLSILRHYEFLEGYHAQIKGYETYGSTAEFFKTIGLEGAVEGFVNNQTWGTPQQILDKLEAPEGAWEFFIDFRHKLRRAPLGHGGGEHPAHWQGSPIRDQALVTA